MRKQSVETLKVKRGDGRRWRESEKSEELRERLAVQSVSGLFSRRP